MALTSATKVIRSALKTFQPVAIPSATIAITSASHKKKWPFHLPQQTNTSAVTYAVVPSAALGKTSVHTNVVIPSTTMAITSANSYCGHNICHSKKYHSNVIFHKQTKKWLLHLPQWQKNISHDTTTWQIISANNIQWLQTNCDNICHIQYPRRAGQKYSKNTIYGKYANIWLRNSNQNIKNNIPHTPTKVGVMVR